MELEIILFPKRKKKEKRPEKEKLDHNCMTDWRSTVHHENVNVYSQKVQSKASYTLVVVSDNIKPTQLLPTVAPRDYP